MDNGIIHTSPGDAGRQCRVGSALSQSGCEIPTREDSQRGGDDRGVRGVARSGLLLFAQINKETVRGEYLPLSAHSIVQRYLKNSL